MTSQYPWEKFYEAAILETDFSQLPTRILAAQTALNSRLEQLEEDHHGSPEERQAIACGLAWIRILEQESCLNSRGVSQQRASGCNQI